MTAVFPQPSPTMAGNQTYAFAAPTLIDPAGIDNWKILGVDAAASPNRILCLGSVALSAPSAPQHTFIYQSEDGGATWSADKLRVANASSYLVAHYWQGFVYLITRDATTQRIEVWRSAEKSGDTPFVWSKVLTLSDGANASIQPIICSTSQALVVCEYGDFAVGPQIWRSLDGATWSSSWGPDSRFRHVHCVAADPYNDGHIYASMGDQLAPWTPLPFTAMRSTDHGVTWAGVGGPTVPQHAQTSFTRDWVWGAADDGRRGTVLVYLRDGSAWRWASQSSHFHIVPPGAPQFEGLGVMFDFQPFQGAVDADGVFYSLSPPSAAGAQPLLPAGAFVLPGYGGHMVLVGTSLDRSASFGAVFVGEDTVWFGSHRMHRWGVA